MCQNSGRKTASKYLSHQTERNYGNAPSAMLSLQSPWHLEDTSQRRTQVQAAITVESLKSAQHVSRSASFLKRPRTGLCRTCTLSQKTTEKSSHKLRKYSRLGASQMSAITLKTLSETFIKKLFTEIPCKLRVKKSLDLFKQIFVAVS